MATKKKQPKPKRKTVPENAKLDSLELGNETRSYKVFAWFEGPDGDGVDFELTVGKQSDLGKEIGKVIDKMRGHRNAKVR